MKAHRIYGVKNKEPFCSFPRGDHVMEDIRIQCYVKKKLKTYYGKHFKCISMHKWSFLVGEIECELVYEGKTARVNDKEHLVFNRNQVAGVFYMNYLVSSAVEKDQLFQNYVDDEIIRLNNCKKVPFRPEDNHLMHIATLSAVVSEVTKRSARNREILSFLLDKKSAMKRHECYARTQIFMMNCNSWFNRFGKEYVLKTYIQSVAFFQKLFEFISLYYFANILPSLATWHIAMDDSKPQPEPGKQLLMISILKEKIEGKDIKFIVRAFQSGLSKVLSVLLSNKGDHAKDIMKNIFGGKITKKIMTFKMKSIPTKQYQDLLSRPLLLE